MEDSLLVDAGKMRRSMEQRPIISPDTTLTYARINWNYGASQAQLCDQDGNLIGAAIHCYIDELSSIDPQFFGNAVYLIENCGKPKTVSGTTLPLFRAVRYISGGQAAYGVEVTCRVGSPTWRTLGKVLDITGTAIQTTLNSVASNEIIYCTPYADLYGTNTAADGTVGYQFDLPRPIVWAPALAANGGTAGRVALPAWCTGVRSGGSNDISGFPVLQFGEPFILDISRQLMTGSVSSNAGTLVESQMLCSLYCYYNPLDLGKVYYKGLSTTRETGFSRTYSSGLAISAGSVNNHPTISQISGVLSESTAANIITFTAPVACAISGAITRSATGVITAISLSSSTAGTTDFIEGAVRGGRHFAYPYTA